MFTRKWLTHEPFSLVELILRKQNLRKKSCAELPLDTSDDSQNAHNLVLGNMCRHAFLLVYLNPDRLPLTGDAGAQNVKAKFQ